MRLGILLLMGLLACNSFQRAYRQSGNEEMEGRKAPAVSGGTWLAAGNTGEREFQAAQWRVVAFFHPD